MKKNTCFIIIVDDGKAARFPLAPAAKSKAASPQALPTQSVNMGGLTYLQFCRTSSVITKLKLMNKFLFHPKKKEDGLNTVNCVCKHNPSIELNFTIHNSSSSKRCPNYVGVSCMNAVLAFQSIMGQIHG